MPTDLPISHVDLPKREINISELVIPFIVLERKERILKSLSEEERRENKYQRSGFSFDLALRVDSTIFQGRIDANDTVNVGPRKPMGTSEVFAKKKKRLSELHKIHFLLHNDRIQILAWINNVRRINKYYRSNIRDSFGLTIASCVF